MTQYEPAPPQHLNALSSGSLLDLLAEAPEQRRQILQPLLRQRGFSTEEIAAEVQSRQGGKKRSSAAQMLIAKRLVSTFSLIIACFNLLSALQFIGSDGPHKIPIAIFSLSLIAFGFYLGLKLNTFLSLADGQRLACGFPCALGHIDVDSGEETLSEALPCYLRMLVNTLVAINFVLFPALLCSYLLT